MEDHSYKTRLLDLLHDGRSERQAWLAQLSDDERAEIGQSDRWAAKDYLAHIAFWQAYWAGSLAALARGEPSNLSPDFDEINSRVFAENRDRPWAEVLVDADRAYDTLVALAEALSEAELFDPQRFPALRSRSAAWRIMIPGYWHIQAHRAQFYYERGDLARATDIHEALTDRLIRFDPSDRGRSIALYNLACFYATTGRRQRALELLPEALRLNPDLLQWAKKDSDLDSVRDDPRFQALPQNAVTQPEG